MVALVFNGSNDFQLIEKYWNVTYIYEADSNLISMSPKEITGLLKSSEGWIELK